MDRNGWKWLEIIHSGWKKQKKLWKLQEMAGNYFKWVEIDVDGWKWLDIA